WYGVSGAAAKPVADRAPTTLAFRPAKGPAPSYVVSDGTFRIRDSNDEEMSIGLKLTCRFRDEAADKAGLEFPTQLVPTGFSYRVARDGKPPPLTADDQAIRNDTRFMRADITRDEDGLWVRATPVVARVPAPTRAAVTDLTEQLLQSFEV